MAKNEIVMSGVIVESCRGIFHVEVAFGEQKKIIKCTPSGKIRINSIHLLKGDKVNVNVSEYDTSNGRIVQRC